MAYLSLMAAPCLDDFVILRGLGDGSSGSVHLVRERETGGLYALKAIRKRKRSGTEVGIEPVMTERNTLLDFRGDDFVLQLRACFHDSRNYYLVTEYHAAGDLHTFLLRKGSPRHVVRFYMAELLIAIEHIHSKRIVHRDIKPENLFLDNDGHIVLGDFGLARKLTWGENTIPGDDMFGTPAYTPPEIFMGDAYGCEVDIWAFGVMLYELITGKEAFKSTTVPQDDPTWLAHLARNIIHDEVEDCPHLTPESIDLIGKLLRKRPKTRLHDFNEIKRHQLFEGLDWDALSNRLITPPWTPNIGPGKDLDHESPPLIPGNPYDEECNPDRDFSFRFVPTALSPTFQRHQRVFSKLQGALPAVVDWVEGSAPVLDVSSASSCTSSELNVELVDAADCYPASLHGPPVRRKNLRPLMRWARSVFGRRSQGP
ncbi:kinase-like domain-containing protein [Russula dissimulans]|nr:kinase-like domain-containing protein [Russula dissimulans]